MKLELQKKLGYFILYLGKSNLLRFVPISPYIVEFRVTENCNSQCVMCNAWKNKFVNELSTKEIKDALGQLRDIGVNTMIFIGGEPLLRPDIGQLVKEASLLKFPIILLVTNGLLLEEKAKELLENGITNITVSVDGIGHGHEIIRGIPGSYEKAIRGIKTVQKLKEDMNLNVAVTLITNMLMKQNVDTIPQLVELSHDLHAFWSFNLLDSNIDLFKGISLSEISVEDMAKIDETIDYLTKVRNESPDVISSCEHMLRYARKYLKKENLDDFHCVHGYEALHVRSNGDVHPCWIMEPIGNLRETKLRDIIGTSKHRELAERIYARDCPGCTNLCGLNVTAKYLISHRLTCERRSKKELKVDS
jgi:MoaA/NifB/PqqE/SkfB family radical SAM enzyme